MTQGVNLKRIVKHWEALRLEAYLPTPDDVPTIGWGHTRGVRMGDKITLAEAEALLTADLQEFHDGVAKVLGKRVLAKTTQNQFDAMVSLAFNIGMTNFNTSSLLKFHKDGNHEAAYAQFHLWIYQNKKRLRGLIRRREMEASLYRTPDAIPFKDKDLD